MANKKKDFQKEASKMLEEAKVRFKKLGEEISVLAKKGEKEIVKASRTGKIQLDIVGLNMQKEKLYYNIGKKVVSLNAKKKIDSPEIQNLLKSLRKLEADARKKKRELSGVRKNA